MSGKLAWEICKTSGDADLLNWKQFILDIKDGKYFDQEEEPSSRVQEKGQTDPNSGTHNASGPKIFVLSSTQLPAVPEEETIELNSLTEYPAVIRRIAHEYASLFQERSKLHAVMTELPESNADSVKAKRAELFDMIKSISYRINILHDAKKNFDETGVIPVEKELFPDETKEPVVEVDINQLDEESLKKMKKNLQNSKSKDQSLLDYQSKSQTDAKNPMPSGPKRTKIEARIKFTIKKIEEVETALVKYAVKN